MQDLAEPDPTRLAYRAVIKQTIHDVATRPGIEAPMFIAQAVAAQVSAVDRSAVQPLVVEELRRLHEGVLARCDLRPSEFVAWKARNSS